MNVVIYFNKEKTSFQVIKPTEQFNGDWNGLVNGVTKGNHHSFKVFKS